MNWNALFTTTLPRPSIRKAATGAITRPWKAGSLTTRGSLAATPAAPAAWPWPRRRRICAATTPGGDVLLVNTLESSRATLELGGQAVTVQQQSGFPRSGESVLTLRLAQPATFALRVRVPAWASPLVLQAEGASPTSQGGWATVPAREWKDGDRITLKFTLGRAARAGRTRQRGPGRGRLGTVRVGLRPAAEPGSAAASHAWAWSIRSRC